MMKKVFYKRWQVIFLVIALPVFFSHMAQASTIEVSGEVSGHWNVDTVKVMADISVETGQLLLIDPGVRVEFYGHFQFLVRGCVVAVGTAGQMIEFTRSDTTGFSDTLTDAGGWHGFFYEHLDPSTDSSLFVYCRFTFGKAITQGDSIGLYGGAFRIVEFNKISFSHCLFEYNHAYRWGGAIYGRQASISIKACEFSDNESGRAFPPWGYGGAICFVNSSPEVISNIFDQNRSTGIGGGAAFEYSDPLVTSNIFAANFSGLGGAIGYLRSQPSKVCSNNLVFDNEARFFGGGIACIRAHTIFVNNTVTDNLAVYGGGFYCNDSAVPSNYNCLFYNNFAFEGIEVYIWDIRSAPNFFYCNVPGDTSGFAGSGGHEGYHGEYLNNLDTIPEFTGAGSYPFQILISSPMKDAGIPDTTSLMIPERDLAGYPRFYNDRIDIGAFEWNPGPGIDENRLPEIPIAVFPNPASREVTIRFFLDISTHVAVSVFNLYGRLILQFPKKMFRAGLHEINWDLSATDLKRIPSGTYLLKLETEFQEADGLLIVTD